MDKKSILGILKSVFSTETEETQSIQYVDVKTGDGRILRVTDVALEGVVKEITEEGELEVEDGTYILEDGISLVVLGGVIKEIIEPEQEDEDMSKEDEKNYEEMKLQDGSVVKVEEGVVMAGDAPAEAGEYILEDGRVLVVGEAGALVEIKEKEEFNDETEEQEVQGVVNHLKDLISQVKDLKSKFESVEKENKELKEAFSKIPSEVKTSTKIDFSSDSKETVKSPLHYMINKK